MYADFEIIISSLVEGVARAGNGFAQSVGEGEKLDGNVIRMLRGALTPDYGALTMEIQYQKGEDEDGFVLVERVSDSLRVLELDEDGWLHAQLDEEPASVAKTAAAGKRDMKMPNTNVQARYNHLPTVPAPKVMQTPQNIPPLYPFSRTSVYVLISPEVAQGTIQSILLKGSSAEQPFELKIPVEVLSESGETIHQLAAKKAVVELEEGRGWLVHAKDEKGVLIKESHSASFQSMVECEAVRLGIRYQIAGKFTSFVATETDPENPQNTVSRRTGIIEETDISRHASYAPQTLLPLPRRMVTSGVQSSALQSTAQTYGHSAHPKSPLLSHVPGGAPPFRARASDELSSNVMSKTPARGELFGSTMSHEHQSFPVAARKLKVSSLSAGQTNRTRMSDEAITKAEETDPLRNLIILQTFDGYWNLDFSLLEIVGVSVQHKAPQGVDSRVWAAVLAITFLEKKMASDKDSWEMVVEKARGWLKDVEEGEEEVLQEKWTLAEQLIMGAD